MIDLVDGARVLVLEGLTMPKEWLVFVAERLNGTQ
jgi:hypothetical protein